MIRPVGTLLIMAAVLPVAGCSYQSTFAVRGTVHDGATGEPISNVKVEIQDGDGHQLANAVFTDQQGEFELTFQTSPRSLKRTSWRVVLEANKFEVTSVNLGTIKEPTTPKETTYIVLHSHLRKSV